MLLPPLIWLDDIITSTDYLDQARSIDTKKWVDF